MSVRFLALMGVAFLLAACGGRAGSTIGQTHPGARTTGRSPAPSASSAAPGRPLRLRWRAGGTFSGTVRFDERDLGAVDDELRFTSQEQFQVLRVVGGVATVRVAVRAWRWQRNTSSFLTTTPPGTSTFEVNAAAEIVSGVDWPLPSELPLPGLDVFASPLGAVAGWSRTDGEGVELAYQLQGSAAPGQATLAWSVVRPQFTRAGDPITVDGRAQVSVVSRYRAGGTTVSLRSTREQALFQRTTQSAAGTTQESGSVLLTTAFSAPSD